ncbi:MULTISPECIES: amidohydrolase family protein [Desulfitobacterium]|uniref:Putative TIM-barrel fold metal-dependent hydrolase n=1 Tax=Desulfitobacterium dehalogenans (strain ATCC 51507 / DSM 9161 / JW/IU-DC1) TaxID=756499 RepID=I4A4E6_DESDJ|nr:MULTISPECIES: amidohydrolase family protein [Desulfitobacterium]AFL98830.1 putative TIM-barrel fold metal-dependent hydrolase [Desulfitobacterium dehalogenans ATCC 51507]
MTIIDFRFRPNTEEILKGISSNPAFKGMCQSIDFNKMLPQTVEEVVQELDHHHVVKAVISGRDCETTYGAKSNNTSVIEFCHRFPDKFIGFAGLDPHKGMAAIEELKHVVNNEGIKGAAIDPYLARIYVNDAKYYPIYAKCCELDIPLIIATGPGTLVPNAVIDHVAPRYIDFVARDFPELKIIVSHGGYPWVNEMITVAQRNANVFLELSEYEFFPQADAYIEAANSILSDKIMYASAHPFVDFKIALKNYEQLPFKPEVREKVMYKNAAKILGLSDSASSVSKTMDSQQIQVIIENVIAQLSQKGMLASR